MKAVVQRVKRSSVTIDGKMVGEIGQGTDGPARRIGRRYGTGMRLSCG